MKSLCVILLTGMLVGCGVKAPPVAPQNIPEAAAPNYDCSPHDPACDQQDPNYKPKSR